MSILINFTKSIKIRILLPNINFDELYIFDVVFEFFIFPKIIQKLSFVVALSIL